MRICGKCGTQVEDSAKFCHSCGAPIEEKAAGQGTEGVTQHTLSMPPIREAGAEQAPAGNGVRKLPPLREDARSGKGAVPSGYGNAPMGFRQQHRLLYRCGVGIAALAVLFVAGVGTGVVQCSSDRPGHYRIHVGSSQQGTEVAEKGNSQQQKQAQPTKPETKETPAEQKKEQPLASQPQQTTSAPASHQQVVKYLEELEPVLMNYRRQAASGPDEALAERINQTFKDVNEAASAVEGDIYASQLMIYECNRINCLYSAAAGMDASAKMTEETQIHEEFDRLLQEYKQRG